MSSKSLSKVNKMMPFEISILNDPAVVSSSSGIVTNLNDAFRKTFGWQDDELVGQNCHLLIPSKFVRKTAHDQKLKGYSFGRDSTIIGKSRIVPVATPEDGEILVHIKIIPIRSKKEFCFMVLFDKIDFDRRLYDFATEFKVISNRIRKLSKHEDFRENDIEASILIKDISRLFAKELEVIGDFIVENRHSKSVLPMSHHFLVRTPIGNLQHLQKLMEKTFENNNISYLNVCCLRIIFPSILSRTEASFLNELKVGLYEESESSC